MVFSIEMLPACEGDCLWVEYGDAAKPHRILVDGGRSATRGEIMDHIDNLPAKPEFDIVVVTHIDRDHIEGLLKILALDSLPFTCNDFWFNSWEHLEEEPEQDESRFQAFGAKQGEKLSSYIIAHDLAWNHAFGHKAIVAPENSLKTVPLGKDMEITLLSPSRSQLKKLMPVWRRECQKAGLEPGYGVSEPPPAGFQSFGPVDIEKLAASEFDPKLTEANESSIAFLIKYGEHKVLFGGDAAEEEIRRNIKLLCPDGLPLKLDAYKVSHHGSQNNTSKELLEAIDCPRYLISTNGDTYGHPHRETIARIIKFGGKDKELIFNYRNEFTEIWDIKRWREKYGYQVTYLDEKAAGRKIRLAI
jgi:hypothetical protein